MPASLLVTLVLLIGSAAAAGKQEGVVVEPLRRYGYVIGDEVELHSVFSVPAGYALDRATLPKPGRANAFLELRAIEQREAPLGRLGRDATAQLSLRFLVVNSAADVRTIATPALELKFRRDGAPELPVRIPQVEFSVSPITPAYLAGTAGLGEMQPDAPPPRIPGRAAQVRLMLYALAALALAGYCAWRQGWVPRRMLAKRPFARAALDLRRMRRQAAPEQPAACARRLHRAFDEAAGFAVASHSLERFFATQPWSAGAEMQIREFFACSARFFYASDGAAMLPVDRLVQLAGALAQREPRAVSA
jgi:mxaA protein